MAQYTITGYDASAHMSEETRPASRSAAWGMVMSVVASVVLRVHPAGGGDLRRAGRPGHAGRRRERRRLHLDHRRSGNAWAEFLLLIAVVAQFFCGTASVTVGVADDVRLLPRPGRARLGGCGARSPRNRVPVNAVTAIGVLAWALMLPTLINGAIGYLVGTSIAVIGLYIAFALPIILRIRAGERFERGAWSLGRHYRWISPLAVAWIAVICVLFLLPVSPKGIPGADDFDWDVVNYAPSPSGPRWSCSAAGTCSRPGSGSSVPSGTRASTTGCAGPSRRRTSTSPDGTSRAGTTATTGAHPAARPVRRGLIVLPRADPRDTR